NYSDRSNKKGTKNSRVFENEPLRQSTRTDRRWYRALRVVDYQRVLGGKISDAGANAQGPGKKSRSAHPYRLRHGALRQPLSKAAHGTDERRQGTKPADHRRRQG